MASAASPSDLDDDSRQAIVGGDAASTCQWPTTALLQYGGTCTGTLIHPRIVVYAAHCGESFPTVAFGESELSPAREVPVDHCDRFIDSGQTGPEDYAYCLLAEAVDDLPATPVIYGCELDQLDLDDPVAIVGFGLDEALEVGTKRWALAQIDSNNALIVIGGGGIGADQGDSGGPAYFQLDDGSWRAIGIVTSGNGGGDAARYVQMNDIVTWVEQESNLDLTPCHDGDGNWAPTPNCEAFATDPTLGGTWAQGCGESDPLSSPSSQCGAPWTEVVDGGAPSVAILDPVDGDDFALVPSLVDVVIDAGDPGTPGVDSLGLRRVTVQVDGVTVQDAFGAALADEVPPFEIADVSLAEGVHHLVAVAEDWAGLTASSAPVQVVVGEPGSDDTEDTEGDGDTDTTDGTTDATDSAGGGSDDPSSDGDEGCGCTSGAPAPASAALLGVVVALARRRRPRA